MGLRSCEWPLADNHQENRDLISVGMDFVNDDAYLEEDSKLQKGTGTG